MSAYPFQRKKIKVYGLVMRVCKTKFKNMKNF